MKAQELREKFPNKERSISDLSSFVSTRSHDQPNYSLLLGSGASVTSGVRSAGELVSEWRENLYYSLKKDGGPYSDRFAKDWFVKHHSSWYNPDKEYASFFEKKFDLPAQRRVFVEQEVRDAFPSIGYYYLAKLVDKKYFNAIFTTNFDDLINEAFFRFANIRPIVCAHDSSIKGITVTSQRPKIIKLHGDYLFDDIKCTDGETRFLEVETESKLKQFLKEYGLIISGYSGCDESVMRVLEELLGDENYLKNGIYWCLRPEDEVCSRLDSVIGKQKVYFVINDGFDELFAEIYSLVINNELLFQSKNFGLNAFDASSKWLKQKSLRQSKSEIIKRHLELIEKETKSSMLANALHAIVRPDSQEEGDDGNLKDEDFLVLLEIQKNINKHNYEEVIRLANENLHGAVDKYFKQKLLGFCYRAYKKLDRLKDAIRVCDELISLDPDNPIIFLRKANVIKDFGLKRKLIESAIERDEYYYLPYYELAVCVMEEIKLGVTPDSRDVNERILDLLGKAIKCRPGISNPSWKKMFDFVSEKELNADSRNKKLIAMINQLQEQDKYNPSVCRLIYGYSRKIEKPEFDGSNIFDYFKASLEKYYPKNDPDFFRTFVDASAEFKNPDFVKSVYKNFGEVESNFKDTNFILAVTDYYLEIHKDIYKAIDFIKERIGDRDDERLARKLIDMLLMVGSTSEARNVLCKNKRLFDFEERVLHESDILTVEGKYMDSVQEIEKLIDDPYFYERHVAIITFNYLKAEDYERARQVAFDFLDKKKFSVSFPEVIINYEFACLKSNKKTHKNRLTELASGRYGKDIQAFSCYLLGNESECLEILRSECEKQYSKIFTYSKWKISEPMLPRLYNALKFSRIPLRVV